MPFEISITEGRASVFSRLKRFNQKLGKSVEPALGRYLAAGLIQRSTYRHSRPLLIIPRLTGGIWITVNYKKLNTIGSLSQRSIPRVHQVLDSLGKGRVFSPFGLVPSFHQITAHENTIPFTAAALLRVFTSDS